MLALRLDEETERRLAELAARTGRTKSFYAREAIKAQLEDLEDIYLADARMANFKPGDAIPLEEVKKQLGLNDDDLDD